MTSRHRCPRPCTYRLATSTPLPSLSHPPRTRRRVVDHRGHSPGRANRGRRAKNAGVATGRVAAAACRWRQNASSITATPELARGDGVATGPVARGPPSREKRTYTHRYAAAATRRASRRVGAAEGLVSVAPGLDPAKAATAPVIGIIIEFLPTGPHQTARGDAPDTTERHKLAQLRPVHGLHAHRL